MTAKENLYYNAREAAMSFGQGHSPVAMLLEALTAAGLMTLPTPSDILESVIEPVIPAFDPAILSSIDASITTLQELATPIKKAQIEPVIAALKDVQAKLK